MSARILGVVAVALGDAAFWSSSIEEADTTVLHLGDLAVHIGPDTPAEGLRALAAKLTELADVRDAAEAGEGR